MNTVYHDSAASDELRRERLYEGQLFVFSPRESSRALCDHARSMIEEAFGGIDPLRAQYEMSVEEYVAICAPLKPAFIHNDRTRELVRAVIEDFGGDLADVYQDVPRLRMVTSHGFLTSGVGYAHHPHRDTWFSAPMCQLNWWLPIYDIESENSMAFHPKYWDTPVKNGSREFNYYEWNSVGRAEAAKQIKADTRKQPKPEEPMDLDPQVRCVVPAGGIVLFSAAQMHSTVPNTAGIARYSIDFRTVSRSDLEARRSAPNIDSEPTGTSLRDFVRCSDGSQLPDEIIAMYDDETADRGALVYEPAVG